MGFVSVNQRFRGHVGWKPYEGQDDDDAGNHQHQGADEGEEGLGVKPELGRHLQREKTLVDTAIKIDRLWRDFLSANVKVGVPLPGLGRICNLPNFNRKEQLFKSKVV